MLGFTWDWVLDLAKFTPAKTSFVAVSNFWRWLKVTKEIKLIDANTPIIVVTTSSSIRVNPNV